MSSKLRRHALAKCFALSLVPVFLAPLPVRAQVYFTGPYGPGGTWNLYEHRGFLGAERFPGARERTTWLDAHEDSINRVENISGTDVRGHLLALSGPAAQQENDFIANNLQWGGSWIGLTDSEQFGGGEAGTNGMAGFGHPPGDGIGWKWTSGEVFDYANWNSRQPGSDDAVLLSETSGEWSTSSASSVMAPYVVEYETHSPTPLNLPPIPIPPLLPGPPARPGAFGIREVARNGLMSRNGYGELALAVQSLQNLSPTAIVRDYYAPVLDLAAEVPSFRPTGPNRPFELLQRGDIAFNQLDDFAVVAHGQILIPEGQGGDWTFSVDSDDGFELYIPGVRFFSEDSYRFFTNYGSFTFPGDKSAGPMVAYVSLQPGVYDLELVYYENKIYSSVELSAAPGRKMPYDSSFALIGAPAQSVIGRIPTVPAGFQLKQVRRTPNDPSGPTPAEQIRSIAEARQLLVAPDGNDRTVNASVSSINHDNISGSDRYGRYPKSSPFTLPGQDFAAVASADLLVPVTGTYTFGFFVLDGGELTIGGAQFDETFGAGSITNGGQSLMLDSVTDDGLVFATVNLTAGTYPLEFVTYNRDREAIAELFVAPGRVDYFDTGAFALLDPTTRIVSYTRPAGLQLVPEPATVFSGIIGALIACLIACRQRQKAEA